MCTKQSGILIIRQKIDKEMAHLLVCVLYSVDMITKFLDIFFSPFFFFSLKVALKQMFSFPSDQPVLDTEEVYFATESVPCRDSTSSSPVV